MKILAYSDIHYHSYTNGLTIDDVVKAETNIINLVQDHDIDVVVFCGDRFVSRNPHYDVLLKATETLDCVLKSIGIDIPFIHLIGNHDQTVKNSIGVNTAEHLSLSGYENLYIFDQTMTVVVPTNKGNIAFHAVPAGTESRVTDFSRALCPGIPNVCLYHGMIKNAKYDTDLLNTDGHDCEFLDNPGFDLVICGDNHRHQALDMFKNTKAWYVGATLQHKWSEAGTKRGYMVFEIPERHVVIPSHLESPAPQFVQISCNANADIFKFLLDNKEIEGNIVRLTVTGTGSQIEKLDLGSIKEYMYKIGAKSAQVKPDYIFEETISARANTATDVDLWRNLVDKEIKDSSGLDPNLVFDLGSKYLND